MNNNQANFTVTNNNASTENNGKGIVIYCSRCGGEMYSNSRYCMKCGNLNPDHPENQTVSKFIEKVGTGYTVGSGQSLVKKDTTILKQKSTVSEVGQHTGGFTFCYLVNMVLYLVIAGGTFFYYYLLARGDWPSIVSSDLGDVLLRFSIFFFFIYSLELLFMKMDRTWWYALIPFYNFYVLADAVIGNSIITKLSIIPGIGQILAIYVFYKMGPCFKKNGLFTALLPFIMIPLIAFDGSAYYGTYYTSGDNRMEDEFHMKRVFLFFTFLFSAFSVGSLVYTNSVHLKSQTGKINSAYIANTANTVVKGVKEKVESGEYDCDFDMDSFYFHFDNVSDYFFIPLSFAHPVTEAYVRVEKEKENDVYLGRYDYYISISDGELGFAELPAKLISTDKVSFFDKISRDYEDGNDCYIRR